jgi:glycosyltransferase involved in cell wall biosynthesis
MPAPQPNSGGSRLWILNHYAAAPAESTGTRHYDLARALIPLGWQTTLFAASATHLCPPRPMPAGTLRRLEDIDGVRFVWVRTLPSGHSRAKRVLNELLCSYRCQKAASGLPAPRVVMGSSAHLFAGLAAWRLARRHGVPFVFEVRDLWPETLVQLGRMDRTHPFVVVLRRVERFLYRRADHLVTLLPGAQEYLARHGGAGKPLTYLPNGVQLHPQSAAERHPSADLVADLRRRHGFVVLYAGAHGQANALDPLLEAARLLQVQGEREVAFVLVGDGREKEALQQLAAREQLRNVHFLPPVPKAALQSVLREADAFYLGWRDSPLYQYGVSPNKLGDYLAAGRPVVHAISCPYDVIREAQCGVSVPAESPARLAEAVVQLRRLSPEERLAMGQRGRAYAEAHLSMERLGVRLVSEVLSVARPDASE